MVTGQLADTPTCGLPSRGLDISRTGQLAQYTTRALVNSRTGQLADWTTRGLADAAKRTKTRMWANAQRDGRPAEYRWRPLFNAAKFG